MGQYYYVVNVTKRQYLHPHKFGDGLKLMEFGASGGGAMLGLAILLSDGNGRGGGDLDSDSEIVGSWAGDQIVIAGDYADPGRFTDDAYRNLFQSCDPEQGGRFEDISRQVLRALCDDEYTADDFKKQRFFAGKFDNVYAYAISDEPDDD